MVTCPEEIHKINQNTNTFNKLEVRRLQANAKYLHFQDVHRIAWHF
jgi:hypothetical protein